MIPAQPFCFPPVVVLSHPPHPPQCVGSDSPGRAALITAEHGVEGGTADKEVIREDRSVVFTPLLCNNKDRGRRGTKGNDGLYTAKSFVSHSECVCSEAAAAAA